MSKQIWYHGTNKNNAKSILKTGFREGTWFAKHLEDAIGYGGEYVFEVDMEVNNEDWQIHMGHDIPTSWIHSLHRYKVRKLR